MIGKRIKIIREIKKMKQGDLAKLLETTKLSISNYERSRNQPSYIILKKICALLNVNPRYLILGEDPIFDTSEN